MSLGDPMVLPAAPALPQATPAQRKAITDTAHKFEAQLMSQLVAPMFSGLDTEGPFTGGQAEATFRSFLTDAIGKQMAKAGGIGIAAPVTREMLKMQGLS